MGLNRFQRLLKRLALTTLQTAPLTTRAGEASNVYVGGAGEGGIGAEARLFGGLVAAQATMAAQLSAREFPLHSLHTYFLRPGRAQQDIHYHVSNSKQGNNFVVRDVEARQNDELILQLQASFHRPEPGASHQHDMPAAPAPEQLPNRDQLRGRKHWQDMPIDVRMVTPITTNVAQPAHQQIWLRANGEVPDDPHLHLALVVYASDRSLLDTAWRPHAHQGELAGASLDHSMWFHIPPKFDNWLLYDLHSPAAGGGRGLAMGAIYDLAGKRVVTVAQEGLLRRRKD